jgi:hypothetical protein
MWVRIGLADLENARPRRVHTSPCAAPPRRGLFTCHVQDDTGVAPKLRQTRLQYTIENCNFVGLMTIIVAVVILTDAFVVGPLS